MAVSLFSNKINNFSLKFSKSGLLYSLKRNLPPLIDKSGMQKIENFWDKKWGWFSDFKTDSIQFKKYYEDTHKKANFAEHFESPTSLAKRPLPGDVRKSVHIRIKNFLISGDEANDRKTIFQSVIDAGMTPRNLLCIVNAENQPNGDLIAEVEKADFSNEKLEKLENSDLWLKTAFTPAWAFCERTKKSRAFCEAVRTNDDKITVLVGKNGQNGAISCRIVDKNVTFGEDYAELPNDFYFGFDSNGDYPIGFGPFYVSIEKAALPSLLRAVQKRIKDRGARIKNSRRELYSESVYRLQNIERVKVSLKKRLLSLQMRSARCIERAFENEFGVQAALLMLAHLYLNAKPNEKLELFYECVWKCVKSPKDSPLHSEAVASGLKDFLHSKMGAAVMRRINHNFVEADVGPREPLDELRERLDFFAEKERNVNTDRFVPAIETVKSALMLNHDYFHTESSDVNFFLDRFVHHAVEAKGVEHILKDVRVEEKSIIHSFEPKSDEKARNLVNDQTIDETIRSAVITHLSDGELIVQKLNIEKVFAMWAVKGEVINEKEAKKDIWRYIEQ